MVDIALRRHRTLTRNVAQPFDGKGPLKPQQQQADLHREGLVQEGRVDRPQRILQRQPLLRSHLVEDVLQLQRLLDVETLRGGKLPVDRSRELAASAFRKPRWRSVSVPAADGT